VNKHCYTKKAKNCNLLKQIIAVIIIFFIFRSVFIWRAGRDGRYETVINMPSVPFMASTHKSKLSGTTGIWIAVCWAEPNLLLTSSLWGELLSWDLSSNKDKPEYKLFHTFHNRGLFSIATVPKYDGISDDLSTDSE